MSTYRDEVRRTAGSKANVTMGLLGLVGEAGELADEMKKVLFHNKPFNRETILKELGDVRWYLEYLADAWGFSMDEIEFHNMAKLRERYPQGFTEHGATKR